MHYAAHTGSHELFRLAVYATAFGAAKLFGASFALVAFSACMALGETQLSQRATEEAIPLRDAFAVLFFVSVGMLFNPAVPIAQPLAVIATVLIIVLGKSAVAYVIVRIFGHPASTTLTVSASLDMVVGYGRLSDPHLDLSREHVDHVAQTVVLRRCHESEQGRQHIDENGALTNFYAIHFFLRR
jgi:predicted Kef-type K+ transport protein